MKILGINSSVTGVTFVNKQKSYAFIQAEKLGLDSRSLCKISTSRKPEALSEFLVKTRVSESKLTEKKYEVDKKKIKKYSENTELLKRAPIVDKIDYVIDKLKDGDYYSAVGMSALAILYGPEDLRDTFSAYKQILALSKGQEYASEYNFRIAQHPLSFFRGSILHEVMNPFAPNAKFKKLKEFLINIDKALINTNLGKKIMEKMGVKFEKIKLEVDKSGSTTEFPCKVYAYEFIGGTSLGRLTARAMTRVSLLGKVADAGIEALEMRKKIADGGNFFACAKESTIEFASSTLVTTALGTIGSKGGPLGTFCSLTLASYINSKVEDFVK